MAFLPWLALLRRCSARAAFWWSYLVGLLFFLGSVWWLLHVTLLGLILLCAYLALYWALFGWITSRIFTLQPSAFSVSLVIPSAWVVLEYLRSHLLSGFGWNLLAYSQTPWPALIQVAEVTGAWGISFLIVLMNVALAGAVLPGARTKRSLRTLAVAVAVLVVVVGYGAWRMPRVAAGPVVRLGVVQGNIPQHEKWDSAHADAILQRYETLSRDVAQHEPQLIVWPETSTPGSLGPHEVLTNRLAALARSVQIPLLVGSPMVGGTMQLTNSAVLLDPDGTTRQRYDKLHLVPFGEFVPFERMAPWLRAVLPPIGDFIPGEDYTVFTTPVSGLKFQVSDLTSNLEPRASNLQFSVLICFEDIFPELARQFVRRGADLLLNITNDAWFGPTSAAFQHAQASTFRAVELRVPVVRAANTGWSGCIDPIGRWRGGVKDADGQALFVTGSATCELPLRATQSVYLRWGDWFAGLCLLVTLVGVGLSLRTRSQRVAVN